MPRKSISENCATRHNRAIACCKYSCNVCGCFRTKSKKMRCETRTTFAPPCMVMQLTLRLALSRMSISPTDSPSCKIFVITGGAPFVGCKYTPTDPSTTTYIPLELSSPCRKSTSFGANTSSSDASNSSLDNSNSNTLKNFVLAKKLGVFSAFTSSPLALAKNCPDVRGPSRSPSSLQNSSSRLVELLIPR